MMEWQKNGIIGQSTTLAHVFRVLMKVAPTDSTVLVTGESGTGKELLVRALHNNSERVNKPFVPINCGAIPKELLESELFGHEKGAFTHAIRTRPGHFELADGGTVFLDEIGEMDLSLQVKILRVIQEKEIERVGGSGTKKVDVRIVAATNRNLEDEVSQGRFREDLYYRLNVIPLHLPPLRERGGDVLLLAQHFMKYFCEKKKRPTLRFAPIAARILAAYAWPGNVRELENFMERLSILVDGDTVQTEDLSPKIIDAVGPWDALPEIPPLDPIPALSPLPEQQKTPLSPVSQASPLPAECTTESAVAPSHTSAVHHSPHDFIWPTLAHLNHFGMGLKEFLDAMEDKLLDEALSVAEGVKNQAAELLKIKRTTLIEKLKKKNL